MKIDEALKHISDLTFPHFQIDGIPNLFVT